MLDSIYVATSGLNATEQGLRVISDNVSNMNSPGYKGSENQFGDIFLAQSEEGGNGYPSGVGGGVQTLPTTVNFQAGTISSTGRGMDLALSGPGFFVLKNGKGQLVYTKDGRFQFNSENQLTSMDTGFLVMGLSGGGENLQPISTSGLQTSAFQTTSNITFKGNLSSTAGSTTSTTPDATVSSVSAYDSMGTLHTLTFNFTVSRTTDSTTSKVSLVPNSWDVKVVDGGNTIGTGTVKLSNSSPDPTADSFTFNLTAADKKVTAVTAKLGSNVTGFSSGTTSTIALDKADGNAAGTLSSTSFDSQGNVVVTYTNTKTSTSGQIAIAEFASLDGLRRSDGASFMAISGAAPRYVAAGDQTQLQSDSLELSNVNLTSEFSTMILIQRGFQASSQVLTTASDMIQSLYDIKSHK